jgi:nucleoside-diphosphate-sugar epimerase
MAPIPSGEVLYLTAPEVVGWGELQGRIAETLGIRTLRVPIPYGILLAYGALAEVVGAFSGVAPLVYRDKARQARQLAWTCSGRKAERLLDFRADVGLDAAVAASAAWYDQAGWL